jgi:hypothetical protein
MAVGVVDGPSVGVGDGPGDPQPVANTPTTTTAARVRAKAATRTAIRDASPCSAAGSEPEVRSESVERGMAGIVAWALEVAVSSSSAVLGIHTGCVVFGSRNCGTKPSEPSGPSSLSPTGGADWAGASGPPFPGGLEGAGTARPSAQHATTQRGRVIPAGRNGTSSPPGATPDCAYPVASGEVRDVVARGRSFLRRGHLPVCFSDSVQKIPGMSLAPVIMSWVVGPRIAPRPRSVPKAAGRLWRRSERKTSSSR